MNALLVELQPVQEDPQNFLRGFCYSLLQGLVFDIGFLELIQKLQENKEQDNVLCKTFIPATHASCTLAQEEALDQTTTRACPQTQNLLS